MDKRPQVRVYSCLLCVQQPCSNPDKSPGKLRKATLGQIRTFAGNLQHRDMPRKVSTETLNL